MDPDIGAAQLERRKSCLLNHALQHEGILVSESNAVVKATVRGVVQSKSTFADTTEANFQLPSDRCCFACSGKPDVAPYSSLISGREPR